MQSTFYFYDLETSGINPRYDRVMQFAGQRTNAALEPIGDPHNLLIRLTPDVLPEPQAVLITGITPQHTLVDGITEREFLEVFYEQIALPGTVFVGYNNIRFDDEFMRFMHYRNFYDAYEWQWKDGRSRWDLLDVIRMMRALRPEGINWPLDDAGKATNRLELLTSMNGLDHNKAHDALSDVMATIALAKMINEKQPKLFSFLLGVRDKKAVAQIVDANKPFVYTSGKYDHKTEKTTVAVKLGNHPNRQNGSSLVYDLRFDPKQYIGLTVQEAADSMRRKKDDEGVRLPVKTIQYNRCPAVAPLAVLDAPSQKRLQLDPDVYEKNYKSLQECKSELFSLVSDALKLLDDKHAAEQKDKPVVVDAQLYEGFFSGADKTGMSLVRAQDSTGIDDAFSVFQDQRLKDLLPLYKARNFPDKLTPDEHESWEAHRRTMLFEGGLHSRLAQYFDELGKLAANLSLTTEQRFLLEELQLYGQSIMPEV